MDMRPGTPNNPLKKAFDEFTKARHDLFIAICHALHIDEFVEWLNNKLTKK